MCARFLSCLEKEDFIAPARDMLGKEYLSAISNLASEETKDMLDQSDFSRYVETVQSKKVRLSIVRVG
jgi:hypothetical protein